MEKNIEQRIINIEKKLNKTYDLLLKLYSKDLLKEIKDTYPDNEVKK